jgi:hypothetical protein
VVPSISVGSVFSVKFATREAHSQNAHGATSSGTPAAFIQDAIVCRQACWLELTEALRHKGRPHPTAELKTTRQFLPRSHNSLFSPGDVYPTAKTAVQHTTSVECADDSPDSRLTPEKPNESQHRRRKPNESARPALRHRRNKIEGRSKYSSVEFKYSSQEFKYGYVQFKYSSQEIKYSSVQFKYSLQECKYSSVQFKYSSQEFKYSSQEFTRFQIQFTRILIQFTIIHKNSITVHEISHEFFRIQIQVISKNIYFLKWGEKN